MKVTLLGVGASAGVPMIGGRDGSGDWGECDPHEPRNRRSRSSIVIESDDNQHLLVDTSPDMRSQLLACRIPSIEAILFTHSHADHITGMDDVRILNRIVDRPLTAYATRQTLEELGRRFGYAFKPWSPPGFYRPVLVGEAVEPYQTVSIAGMAVSLFNQNHGRIDTLGVRIGSFGYSTDVVKLDDAAFAVLEGVNTWVVGCFLRKGPHWTHADLDTVQTWVARLKPRRTILTHMGTDMDWAWLQANLPAGIEAGYDGMELIVTE
ncbi:MBL fold metallo-hydrolase [Rhodopila sp.]|uniref:MBL fold metallo-hydrolase n=1 Tax=Rhodopila sp. TaxID=2480087 RepID=UPI002C96ED80|nr:MBL fold metallo-hydrolase [Rhodopila sp.]HVZ08303.1 MBL fold metallo-hydrolase [Rhodopila sp.]